MPGANPLTIFAPRFNAAAVPWMVVGSIASNAYGEARMTLDVDVVVVMPAHAANRFAAVFPEESFYCPPVDVIRAEAERGQRGHFNVIDNNTIFKADVYLAAGDPLEQWAFRHRRQLEIDGALVWLAPPEYVIIHKLEFLREGGREKHIRDIGGMLAVTDVDHAIVEEEIARRGLAQQWALCAAT